VIGENVMTIDLKHGFLKWDTKELASALKITEKDVIDYLRDGRRVSFIIERRLAWEVIGGKLAVSEGAGYDLIDKNGGKWEVRSISNSGIYFCPSCQVGSGRSFEEHGFIQKLNEICGYFVSDITQFPRIPYWEIPADVVKRWWDSGKLGKNTKISRKRALKLLSSLYNS